MKYQTLVVVCTVVMIASTLGVLTAGVALMHTTLLLVPPLILVVAAAQLRLARELVARDPSHENRPWEVAGVLVMLCWALAGVGGTATLLALAVLL